MFIKTKPFISSLTQSSEKLRKVLKWLGSTASLPFWTHRAYIRVFVYCCTTSTYYLARCFYAIFLRQLISSSTSMCRHCHLFQRTYSHINTCIYISPHTWCTSDMMMFFYNFLFATFVAHSCLCHRKYLFWNEQIQFLCTTANNVDNFPPTHNPTTIQRFDAAHTHTHTLTTMMRC